MGNTVSESAKHRVVRANDRHTEYSNKEGNAKHSPFSLIPLTILAQLQKPILFYYLVLAILQLFPAVSPVHPAATWVPLLAALLVGVAREHRAASMARRQDEAFNSKIYEVIVNGKSCLSTKAQHIRPGDIVKVEEGDEAPADLIILVTSEDRGDCLVETVTLDGDTALKTKRGLPQLQRCYNQTGSEFLRGWRGVFEVPPPSPDMGGPFQGRLLDGSQPALDISQSQFLPKSTYLRLAKHLWGVAVYCGKDAKIGQTMTRPRSKDTVIDLALNRAAVVLIVIQVIIAIVMGAVGAQQAEDEKGQMWYLQYDSYGQDIYLLPLSFFILSSFMIPISLKITLDIAKFYSSRLIEWDINMYDYWLNEASESRNTAVADNLGAVSTALVDKTGTLTMNSMALVKCVVGAEVYSLRDESLRAILEADASHQSLEVLFFLALSLCTSVDPRRVTVPEGTGTEPSGSPLFISSPLLATKVAPPPVEAAAEKSPGPPRTVLDFQTPSPDERAFACGARDVGVVLMARTKTDGLTETCIVNIRGSEEKFDIIQSLGFTEDRRRLSVVVRSVGTGRLILFTRGSAADVIPRRNMLHYEFKVDVKRLESQLRELGKEGLRTQVFAFRPLSEKEYVCWKALHDQADSSGSQREKKLSLVFDELERDLLLMGATGVADFVCDGVPEAIDALNKAEVKLWVLTGDHHETMHKVALSAHILDPSEPLYQIEGTQVEEVVASLDKAAKNIATHCEHLGVKFGLLLSGETIRVALQCSKERTLDMFQRAKCVLFCHVTPAQKAALAGLAAREFGVCLTIGDGGDDVAMIREAHIGLAVGPRATADPDKRKAHLASDYSLSRFSHVVQLLLVHGHFAYYRCSFIIQYCFYKSIMLALVQIIYNGYTLSSGAPFFDSFFVSTYNLVWTGLPVLLFVLDKDFSQRELLEKPQLYALTRQSKYFNRGTMFSYVFRSITQSVLLGMGAVYGVESCSDPDTGRPFDLGHVQHIVFASIIIMQMYTVLSFSRTVTNFNKAAVVVTLVGYFLACYVANVVPTSESYGNFNFLVTQPSYYLYIALLVVASLLPPILVSRLTQVTNKATHDAEISGVLPQELFFMEEVLNFGDQFDFFHPLTKSPARTDQPLR